VSVLALTAAVAVVSDASALAFDDSTCPDVAGENTNTCPTGTVGVPYSIQFKEREGSGCGAGLQTFAVISGTFPPGLSLASGGQVSGTPRQSGIYKFYVEMSEPTDLPPDQCRQDKTQREFTIEIKPGVPTLPKLTIGPESISATGTVGSAYSVAMTANLSDPKTWSIVAGSLPPGLAIGTSDGVISGTPTAAGSYTFTVRAGIDASRSDTKTLTIAIRDRLAIAASTPFAAGSSVVRTEVGVIFDTALVATGGFGTYTWSVSGDVPLGLTFDPFGGTLTGAPEEAGSYRFTVSVADSEGRVAAYAARVIVAKRLAISTQRFRAGKVSRFYRAKLRSVGGVGPVSWRLKRGPLPRGIKFDRFTGSFFGRPTRTGMWRISVEVVDSLRVKSTATITITVGSQLKLRAKRR